MPPKGYKLSAQAKEHISKGLLKIGVEVRVDAKELSSLYWDKQLSAREIAQLKGVSDSCVFQWLWRFKIPRRSPSEYMKLAFQRQPYPLTGENHPAWRGGRTRHGGYVYVHIYTDHPLFCMAAERHGPSGKNGGWVAEHRLVMAQHLGRPLEKWEIVHHKNGVKDDNRPENLELYPKQASHVTHTMFKRELAKCDKEIRLLKWQVRVLTQRMNEAGIPNPVDKEVNSGALAIQ